MSNSRAAHRIRLRRWPALLAAALLAAAVLIPASPAAAVDDAQINGTITFSPGGGPVDNSTVALLNELNQLQGSFVLTDEFGYYEFTGLAAGDYKVCTLNLGTSTPIHAGVCWDYRPYLQMSETFPVAESAVVTRDIVAVAGGTLTGTVTGEDGPSDNWDISLDAYYDDGGGLVYGYGRPFEIDGSGNWTVNNVLPGTYRIRYLDSGLTGYRVQLHDQATSFDLSEFVVVTDTASLTFDATMSIPGPVQVDRLSGSSRYETALEVSREFDPFGDGIDTYAYIAVGTNYPDALAAAALAGKLDAPLLLTPSDVLPAAVIVELERLEPRNIIIAGGPSVISEGIRTQLEQIAYGPDVVRWGGANRYETARLLVEDAFPIDPGFTTAFIATGRNYADALAAAATAASRNAPVILVDGALAALDVNLIDWMSDSGVETVFIAGGTSAVSAGIEAQLVNTFGPDPGAIGDPGVTRLGGADRYATSLLIANITTAYDDNVYLATGAGFADALAGAALAGARSAALFTVPGTCVPSGVRQAIADFGAHKVVLLGGPSVLTTSVFALTKC